MEVQIGKDIRWIVAPEVKKKKTRKVRKPTVFDVAKDHGWDAKLVGRGGLIQTTVETNGWLVMPLEQFKGSIPPEALQIMDTVKSKCNIKGFLIADDKRANPDTSQNTSSGEEVIAFLVKALLIVAIGIAILPFIGLIAAFMGAVRFDPILIAVTEEDEWVSLYEWFE